MPAQDRLGRHEHDGAAPGDGCALGYGLECGDDERQGHLFSPSKAWWGQRTTLQDGELVAQRQNLQVLGRRRTAPSREQREEEVEQAREQEREHRLHPFEIGTT